MWHCVSKDHDDHASKLFVSLVKDVSVMKFDDRDSSQIPQTPRVVAGSVDNDGEETAVAADGQSVALVKALDALRDALLKQK